MVPLLPRRIFSDKCSRWTNVCFTVSMKSSVEDQWCFNILANLSIAMSVVELVTIASFEPYIQTPSKQSISLSMLVSFSNYCFKLRRRISQSLLFLNLPSCIVAAKIRSFSDIFISIPPLQKVARINQLFRSRKIYAKRWFSAWSFKSTWPKSM